MKYLVLMIGINLLFFSSLLGQNNEKNWQFKDKNYNLSFNFGDERFNIDTMITAEGPVYSLTLESDSGCIILYDLSIGEFTWCSRNDCIHVEIESCKRDGILDARGIRSDNGLYWRGFRDYNLNIVYDYCPKEKLEYFDKIFDSIVGNLKSKD